MPRPRIVEPSAIALRLQSGGLQPAQLLAAAFRVDRSNITRALALPDLAAQLVRLGTPGGTTYAWRRAIRGLGSVFPIRRINAEGRIHDWAQLVALHGGWQFIWADPQNAPAWAGRILGVGGYVEGFPFFPVKPVRRATWGGRSVGR